MNTTTTTTPSPAIVSYACPLVSALSVLNTFAIPAVSVLGVLANTYCIAVFAFIIRFESTNGHMFKYLLLKAIHDTVQFAAQSFSSLYYCTTCSSWGSYSMQIWYIWFYYYVEAINELCSGLFEVAATLDCLLNLSMKFEFFKRKLVFYITTAVITVYPCLFYIFFIYEFKIVKIEASNTTQSYYTYAYTDFTYTEAGVAFGFVHGLVRDVIIMLALVILNGFILFIMKKSFERKRRMVNAGPTINGDAATLRSARSQSSTSAVNAHDAAERNVTIMIVANGLNYFVGHFAPFVKYCVLTSPSVLRSCVTGLSLIVFYWSYVSPFFIYFSCNKLFRQYALCSRRGRVGARGGATVMNGRTNVGVDRKRSQLNAV
jgi:hypothetical protein